MADKGEDPQAIAAAEEAAAGALAASGIAPIAGVGAAMVSQLRVEGETLETFKNRVDGLLTRLEESKAAPHRIAGGSCRRDGWVTSTKPTRSIVLTAVSIPSWSTCRGCWPCRSRADGHR